MPYLEKMAKELDINEVAFREYMKFRRPDLKGHDSFKEMLTPFEWETPQE